MTIQEFDVIIVGRGPVGLFLACELRLQDVSVLIVERRTQLGLDGIPEIRASALQGRTNEILENRGLLSTFDETSIRSEWWHYGILETRLRFDVLANESDQAGVSFIPQSTTEEIFKKRALELGVVIKVGVRVETLEQTSDVVTISGSIAKLEPGTVGDSFVARGKYLVGADGWNSSIRSMAGFGWEYKVGTHMMMVAELTPAVDIPPFLVLKNEKGLVVYCKLNVPSGRSRIAIWTPSRSDIPSNTPVNLEDFNQAFMEVMGRDCKLGNPCGLDRISNESGSVTSYRKGRVFLGGDAGHSHLPAGGQGMNLGIQEVTNLGWKLGAVIRGEAPESLLNTYETERLPVAQEVVKNTTAQSVLFFANDAPAMALRSAMNELLEIPETNRKLAKQLSGFGDAYPTPLEMILPGGWSTLPENLSGRRVPDVTIHLRSGEEKRLSNFLRAGKWVQLSFNGKPSTPAFGGRTEVVDVASIPNERGENFATIYSEILIRPDGHFGFGKI